MACGFLWVGEDAKSEPKYLYQSAAPATIVGQGGSPMRSGDWSNSVRLVGRIFDEGVLGSCSDAELVERFTSTRDPDAFGALVARHGATVMAVCRGLLGPGGDADDAFQATFLVLLNRAGSFPVGQSLGGWLYRVARRAARQARLADSRRRKREAVAGFQGEPTASTSPGGQRSFA